MKKILTLTLVIVITCISSRGQKLTVTDIQVKGQLILVNYNLEDVPPGNELYVQLFSSIDNFISPVKKVSGDVGNSIEPGLNKTITWNYADEYPDYKGKISLEVRGRAFVPVARFRNIDQNSVYKRGKNYSVDWKPGNNKVVDIELYQGSTRVQGESNINNSGSYNLHLLTNLKPGNEYRIKISDSRNPEENTYSEYFTVKRKIPLIAKIVPITIASAFVINTILNSTSNSTDSSEIPAMPGLPSSN
jgi:hypothetical protein